MWWTVSMLMRSTSDASQPFPAPYEERIILVEADEEGQAIELAKRNGMDEEISYRSISGASVEIRFFKILATYQILGDRLKSGIEIFSRHLRESEAISLQTPFEE